METIVTLKKFNVKQLMFAAGVLEDITTVKILHLIQLLKG